MPLLFRLAPNRRRRRVLDLEPVRRSAGAVRRAQPLRHDALAAERARVLVDRRAVTAEVLIGGDTVMREPKQAGEPALAVLDRFAPDVFAVHLEEVERAEYRGRIAPVRADELEHGQAAVAADYGLAVEDARADGQRLNRFRDEREAVREVVAVAGEEPNGAPAPVREDPEAVVFDLVNPARARRRLAGRSRQAGGRSGERTARGATGAAGHSWQTASPRRYAA